MRSDSLSPFAPARVRALVLPLGRIRRSRFLTFYDALTDASVVKLKHLPDNGDDISGRNNKPTGPVNSS